MRKAKWIIKQRSKLLKKAARFNRKQQSFTGVHMSVYETIALLDDPNLVWDSDLEAIRRPLLVLIRAELRTGLHLRDLEMLCRMFGDSGKLR